jgi:hypothetical protein
MRQITRLELDWEYLEKDLAEFLVLMVRRLVYFFHCTARFF